MPRKPIISPIARITLGLLGLGISMVFLASSFGFFGDKGEKVASRKQLAESLAISFSTLAQRFDAPTMTRHFESVVERNHDLVSLGIRKPDENLMLRTQKHPLRPFDPNDKSRAETDFNVPVMQGQTQWGALECRFQPPKYTGWWAIFGQPEFRLAAFLILTCAPLCYGYLSFVLRHLNPSKAIPKRVRDALDSLAEGLIVVDRNGDVVMANQAFQDATNLTFPQLVGSNANTLPFRIKNKPDAELPWAKTLADGQAVRGQIMEMVSSDGVTHTFSVSCTPVTAENGSRRGAMISLENVTELERQRARLGEMVQNLQASGARIAEQNRELEILATRDALTGCLNRRSYFNLFDQAWNQAKSHKQPLSAMMIDIDHFKSVNDNHGHAMGDEVLRQVGRVLRETMRQSDIVSRYGGEEFSIVMPMTTLDEATQFAEALRIAISLLKFPDLKVTASLGVSALCQKPIDTQGMLEQADKCLYFAKRNGRNQVARWDVVPDDMDLRETEHSPVESDEETTSLVPFRAVSALISALAFRDQETASHSRRVADLCVLIGRDLVSMRECYLLEIAGLLHDIGKIGVPDAILLKPEALTDEEWKIMQRHERMGVEIVKRSFESEELNQIIRGYRLPFQSQDSTKPSGSEIPIGARILALADAYDAMTSERVYRNGMSHEETMAEIRESFRFDPRLVERLDECMSDRLLQTNNGTAVSKDAALSIGLQMESLSAAIDEHDTDGVVAMAKRLSHTALKHGVTDVATKAEELTVDADTEDEKLIAAASELLDLCRSTQSSLLDASLDTVFFGNSNNKPPRLNDDDCNQVDRPSNSGVDR